MSISRISNIQNRYLYNGTVTAATPGAVANPKVDSHAQLELTTTRNTRAQFHSHPSGQIVETTTTLMGSSTKTYGFTQAPSNIDVSNIGSRTGYVFGRGSNQIDIYNKSGVVATFPVRTLRR